MKKIFGLILTVMSFLFVSPEMYTGSNAVAGVTNPQIRVEIGQRDRWRNRNRYRNYSRTYTTTRYVRRGWRTYRETYQITYFPDGRTQTTLVDRVRVS
jgi:hypothetical protein